MVLPVRERSEAKDEGEDAEPDEDQSRHRRCVLHSLTGMRTSRAVMIDRVCCVVTHDCFLLLNKIGLMLGDGCSYFAIRLMLR
jgi:hypothetical protein